MSRPLRIAYHGAWYHIMNRGLARNPIFIDDNHRQLFFDLLSEINNKYQAEIHAYCLMNNHYHLLIRTPLGNISRIMRHLDGIYTQRFNKSIERDGPLFRGRYKSILVEADVYIVRLSRYIHLNPVKAKLVQKAEHFFWSSYNAYLFNLSPHWLSTEFTLNYFGNYNQREKYKGFVEEGTDNEIDQFYKKLKTHPILGSDAFIKNISEKYLKDQHKIDEIPEYRLLANSGPIEIENIMKCIAEYYDISVQDIKQMKRRNDNQPRAIAMYLAHTVGDYTFSRISSYFSDITLSGIAHICNRLQLQIRTNSQLQLDINRIKKIILDMSNFQT